MCGAMEVNGQFNNQYLCDIFTGDEALGHPKIYINLVMADSSDAQ